MYQKGEQADPHQQPAINRLKRASDSAKKMVWLKMAECSAPAMVVGVAVNGKPVWKHGREGALLAATIFLNFDTIVEGFGYSDVENQVGATPNTVMRIASISKSITMAALGKLMDEGRVELDKSVSDLVQEWPKVSTQAETNNICVMLRFNHSSRSQKREA